MGEAEERITEAERLMIYKRLSDHLRVPGRLDEAIFVLGIQVNNMLSPNAASATLARIICDQLELRIPPELSRLASLLEEWEGSQPPDVGKLPSPMRQESPRLSTAEKVAILGPQIVIGLMTANCLLAALCLWLGKGLMEVITLWVALTSMTLVSVYCCSRFSEAPKSIPEAQFIFQAHQGRMEYVAKGLLENPARRRAA